LPLTVLQRVARGEPDAVAECIDRFGGLVWLLARRTLSPRADIDDTVQEIFVELWKSAHRYDPAIASERAFVATIARRRLIDRGRRERRRLTSTVDSADTDLALSPEPETARPSELNEETTRAAAAMRQLSAEQQQAIRLSIYHGLSHQEIADRMGQPLGTVKTNLRRGLIRIRELLGAPRDGNAGDPFSNPHPPRPGLEARA
jgi:RNA polymerase sigma-70 factor (ECF subfamily)